MFTVDKVIESLQKFDIDEATLQQWEKELGLSVPTDKYGWKQYSPHHINLFKNIKKHLTLGRTLAQIKKIITLPPVTESKPATTGLVRATRKSPYASVPKKPAATSRPEDAGNLVELLDRLTREKDKLASKLSETEKLNSHLYNANGIFNRKVQEMTTTINALKEQMQENHNFKLLDDKSKLHQQLISFERVIQQSQMKLVEKDQALSEALTQIRQLEATLTKKSQGFNPAELIGDWIETAQLQEVTYDNFGINLEPERVRLFRIAEAPARIFGNTAVITTNYDYETNALWKRTETLTVSALDENHLAGELVTEYILDDVPVVKAIYRVTCERNRQ